MIKRILCAALTALMLAASFAGCAAPSKNESAISPMIRVTSSDANDAAQWLTDRLDGKPAGPIVIGTDASGYDVDLSSLEDDGFVIRNCGGEIVLLARTSNGLDRAARKYAKAVESNTQIEDETFREGYRVKELRLAGIDVSEYAISVEAQSDYYQKKVTSIAAQPFAELIKLACGAELSVGGDAEHKIIFRQITDASFKESSYRYFFEGGDLMIDFTEIGGARNGMVKFLENECGWTDLMYGRDELAESDFIDVPETKHVLCHPRFDGIRLTGFYSFAADNSLGRINSDSFMYKYRVESAHHYLGNRWAVDYGWFTTGHYPCLTSDEVFDTVFEEVSAYVDKLRADGAKIGEDLVTINMGTQDESRDWCMCKDCMAVYKREGSWSGPLIAFLNRFEEAMDQADYDGLKYSTFGYVGSNKPPKTIVPNDDIYITFVYNNSCTHHCVNGTQCLTDKTNPNYAEYILGWCELTPNVYVRPAPLSAPMHPFTIIDQVWDDVKWLGEVGVKCIYNEIYTWNEFDTNLIACELWEAMMFDPEMTRAEYYEEVCRLFEKYYGDGWRHVLNYVDLLEKTENATEKCWSVWNEGYLNVYDEDQYDMATYRALWDEMLAELESAKSDVKSKVEEDRVNRLIAAAIYEGCIASYYVAYEEYDDEKIEMLDKRWAYMIECAKKSGAYDLLHDSNILDSLEDTAWAGAWTTNYAGKITNHLRYKIVSSVDGLKMTRPVPDKYSKQ